MLKLFVYFLLFSVIYAFVAVFTGGEVDFEFWRTSAAIVLTLFIYLRRNKPHVLPAFLQPGSSRRRNGASVTVPGYLFENQRVPQDQTERIKYDHKRWKSLAKDHAKLLHMASRSYFKEKPRTLFANEAALGALLSFNAKHMADLRDEMMDGRLDWNNENCKMFFQLMRDKYRASDRSTLGLLLYISGELEYLSYYDAMQIKSPGTIEELLRQTALYDIYREKGFSPQEILRYAESSGMKTRGLGKRLSAEYERAKEGLKLSTFEDNLLGDKERRSGSIEQQLRQATRDEYFAITSSHQLSLAPEDYEIVGQDYSRDSAIDRFYRQHLAFALTQAFGGLCCRCGEGMQQLEFDHFWLPKSQGGNFAMRSTAGYYVNNCIPLCRSCNASKGAKSFLEFFPHEEVEGVIEKSQSMNGYINSHMVEFRDSEFGARADVGVEKLGQPNGEPPLASGSV